MHRRWRVEYEEAFVRWVERQRPSLIQICAVIRWLGVRKSVGPPEDVSESPDPDRPEDRIGTVPTANVDVLFLAYESENDAIMFVRDFTSF